ncbi:MAG TPA: Holliday junction resolvase RuvX [Candidatus Limnocylindria bacterium]|nr:Holliday junction resolvase RuvX [Candidatus Limnocylindria bacterium]
MRYLALDVGDRTIGLAVGEETFGLARPLVTLRRRSVSADLEALREIVNREDVGALVIGLPLTLGGETGYQAARARSFAESARALGRPIELVDERFTTAEAQRRGEADLDAGAATVLLEDFFSARRRGA